MKLNRIPAAISRIFRRFLPPAWCCLALLLGFAGCKSRPEKCPQDYQNYLPVGLEIEYPDAEIPCAPEFADSPRPLTVENYEAKEPWRMTLQEAILIALSNTEVMRDAGGRVVSAPAAAATVYDPALTETNPLAGVEAALSDFDAQFSTSVLWGRNQQVLNNALFGGGVAALNQETGAFRAEINKVAPTGTTFVARNITNYDLNNAPFNRFPSSWVTNFEVEARHPLWQGSGVEFNRIAGPNARAGSYNGVMIARINTDISLSDFETAIRDLLTNVESTYWELYFAYRDLEASLAARDAALRLWRIVSDKQRVGEELQPNEDEPLVRAQYYEAQVAVENALGGIRTAAGLTGGVQGTERRLRLLLGLRPTDHRMIRPADEPSRTRVQFDWSESLATSLWQRVELRRQKWNIKRRELELTAARNFLLMRLDFVGLYRWRGLGDDLMGNPGPPNGSAFADLFDGDQQDYQYGLQLSTPIGNRIGHVAVRNAELQLARERAIYVEQERTITHELSTAFAELDRAHAVTKTYYNRLLAARQQQQLSEDRYLDDGADFRFVLDDQRRRYLAESAYHRSLVDYNIAILNLHRAKGGLLGYMNVELAEGPWLAEAHRSAAKQSRRFRENVLNYCIVKPEGVTRGVVTHEPPPYHTSDLRRLPALREEAVPTPDPAALPATPERHWREAVVPVSALESGREQPLFRR